MELGQHVGGDFRERFFQRPAVAPEMQPDVLDARVAHGVQFLDERETTSTCAEAMTL